MAPCLVHGQCPSLLFMGVGEGVVKVRDESTFKVRKGFLSWLLKIYCFLLEALSDSPLHLTARLAEHEYPRIKNHVTLLFHKLWKPKSDCIHLWVVGDNRRPFSFQSHAQNEMFSHQAFYILEFNYKTLPFSSLGWLLHPRKSDKRQSL